MFAQAYTDAYKAPGADKYQRNIPEDSIELLPYKIPLKSLDTTVTLRIPHLPNHMTQPVRTPIQDYHTKHAEWKRRAMPWLSEEELQKSCGSDVKAFQMAFPTINDEPSILAMAAILNIVCDVDDRMEGMDVETAKVCVRQCVPILEDSHPPMEETRGITNINEMRTLCHAFRQHIVHLLPRHTAKAVLTSTQEFISSQIGELQFRRGQKLPEDYAGYLDIRIGPFGLLPIITVAEHYFLSHAGRLEASRNLSLMIQLLQRLAVPQNDIAGLEKDLNNGNVSNTVFVLAMLEGRVLESKGDVLASPDILRRVEREHDALMERFMELWRNLQAQAVSWGEVMAGNALLTLCVTHLKWSLSTSRYEP